jgi:hypothetical protein
MPIIVPPFAQYQAPLFPLRGLWNEPPAEGDRMVAAEIDWGVTVKPGLAVQFALSGNSPVAFSQIVAMQVDNTANNVDVQFQFPDSGYVLTVPAYNQGVYPVFTNALQFYVFSPGAVTGDRTLFQVFNSMPPPVSVSPSVQQSHAAAMGILLSANATVPIIPAPTNGTINALSVTIDAGTATVAQNCNLNLFDGTGVLMWAGAVSIAMQGIINLSGLELAFHSGVNAIITSTTIPAGGFAIVNIYYSLP